MSRPSPAIILFAHGSRDPLWAKPIEAVAAAIRQQNPTCAVRCAYLELMLPSLADAAAALAGQGFAQIRIVPMFLGVGKHAKEDLPLLVDTLVRTYPHIQFELAPSIGEHPQLIHCIAQIALAPT